MHQESLGDRRSREDHARERDEDEPKRDNDDPGGLAHWRQSTIRGSSRIFFSASASVAGLGVLFRMRASRASSSRRSTSFPLRVAGSGDSALAQRRGNRK